MMAGRSSRTPCATFAPAALGGARTGSGGGGTISVFVTAISRENSLLFDILSGPTRQGGETTIITAASGTVGSAASLTSTSTSTGWPRLTAVVTLHGLRSP